VTTLMSFLLKTLAVLEKDAKSEFRAKYALNSILLFCFTCVLVVSFSLRGTVQDTRIVAALLWVILFFSAMTGLSRTFIKEEDQGTMNTLRLVCEPTPLFVGKALMNFALMLVVIIIVTPPFVMMMNVDMAHPMYFAPAAALAALGMSGICTLMSGIVAGARGRGTLYPVLVFPVLLPVFWVAVDATDRALSGPVPWQYSNLLVFLGAFAAASYIGGALLFEFIYSE